jgi:hypothetical protein
MSAQDVTATPVGQTAAGQAAQRLTAAGHPTVASDLVVTREVDGSISTRPKGMERVVGLRPDGTYGPSVVLDAGKVQARPAKSTAGVAQPMAAQYWSQINNGCLSLDKTQGWMYSCWTLKKMQNDGYPNNDFYIVTFDGETYGYATGSGIGSAYVEVYKNSSSAAFTMVAWSPKQNYSQGCTTAQIGVSYVLSFTMNVEICENWTWYADPLHNNGTQWTQWTRSGWQILGDGRETTLIQQVQTAQNKSPIWNLAYDFV